MSIENIASRYKQNELQEWVRLVKFSAQAGKKCARKLDVFFFFFAPLRVTTILKPTSLSQTTMPQSVTKITFFPHFEV